MSNEHLLTAFMLTVLAGLGTVVGSCIAFLAKRTDHRFLSIKPMMRMPAKNAAALIHAAMTLP